MPQQQDLFNIDMRGRITAKLGLSADHEILIDLMDAAKTIHTSLRNYQVAVVDCEMKRLSAGDRATELSRVWNVTYASYENLGEVIDKAQPLLESIHVQVNEDIAAERKTAAETKVADSVDAEYDKLIKGGMPVEPPPSEGDEADNWSC